MSVFIFSWRAILLALGAIYALRWLWLETSHSRRARQLGCKQAFKRPSKWPLGIDILMRYTRTTHEQIQQIDDLVLYEELGKRATWHQSILGNGHYMTVDPKNVQALLTTQFKDFELGPNRYGVFAPLIGKGIFTSDGKEWEHSRALLRPQFSRSKVADLELDERHVQALLGRLTPVAGSWTQTVDMAPLFFHLTLDTSTEFLFGQSVHSQRMTGPGLETHGTTKGLQWASFGRSFDDANLVVTIRSRLMDFYWLYAPRSFHRDCNDVQRFAEYYIQLALAGNSPNGGTTAAKEGNAADKEGYVFLEELVKLTRDPEELRGQLLNILLAGRDTTAGLLGWTFYLLARHPDVYTKLRTAILDQFGPYKSSTENVSFERLKSCSYLQHVMSEALRLHPIVPENGRRAVRNTTLPRGGGPDGASPIYVRAGTEVAYNVHIMHRRTDIWGPDAAVFKPERWLHHKAGWEYLPFNGGPRICLGQQFALTEAGYTITRIVQKFDRLENMDPSTIEKGRFTSTTSPVNVLVRLHEAPSQQ